MSDDTRKVEPSPDGAISPAGIFVAPATDRATGRPAPQTTEPVDCSAVESVSTAEPISPSAGRLPRPSDETWLNSDNRWPPSFENDTVHPGLRESRLRMSSCWQVLEAGSAVVAPRAYCARPVVPGPGLQHPLLSPRLLAGSLNPRSAVRRHAARIGGTVLTTVSDACGSGSNPAGGQPLPAEPALLPIVSCSQALK